VIVAVALMFLVGCGIGAVLTRPVRESHHTTLSETAQSLTRSLRETFNDYGDAAGQAFRKDAFRAHFPKLEDRLEAWDQMRLAAGDAQGVLSRHLDADMTERGIVPEAYDTRTIKARAQADAIARAEGNASDHAPLEWEGYTTAGSNDTGPPYGVLAPKGERDWITLPPVQGESKAEWEKRGAEATGRVDAFLHDGPASAEPRARAFIGARARVEARKRDEVPALREALRLIEEREAPRVRRRCESC
jgi:hypothetical protein